MAASSVFSSCLGPQLSCQYIFISLTDRLNSKYIIAHHSNPTGESWFPRPCMSLQKRSKRRKRDNMPKSYLLPIFIILAPEVKKALHSTDN
jgi:hypothetical protein